MDRDLRFPHFPRFSDENLICSIAVAAISAGTALVGSAVQAGAAKSAAKTQANAANQATAIQQSQFNQNQANLAPYNTAGQTATNALMYGEGIGPNNAALSTGGDTYGSLTAPVSMTEAALKATPGYQFSLSQGLESTQNAMAARGLGVSGAALKGAANFATGLADNTYQQQFQNAVTNQTNAYNRLMGTAQTGENAAAQAGISGTQGAANIAATTQAAGNAIAGGQIGSANALSNGFANIGNAATTFGLLGGGGLFGGAAAASNAGQAILLAG